MLSLLLQDWGAYQFIYTPARFLQLAHPLQDYFSVSTNKYDSDFPVLQPYGISDDDYI